MSNYTYTAADMVQLPRLSGPDAMALGEQILSAARPHREALQRPVTRALTALAGRHGDLKEVLRDQVAPDLAPGASAVPQDRAVDGCWGGLDGFLVACTRLPAAYPQAAEAAEIRAAGSPSPGRGRAAASRRALHQDTARADAGCRRPEGHDEAREGRRLSVTIEDSALLEGIDLRHVTAYLGSSDWKRREDFPRKDLVVFDGPLADDGEPISAVLPAFDKGSDFRRRLAELLGTLAILEERPAHEIALDMRSPGVDRVLARVISDMSVGDRARCPSRRSSSRACGIWWRPRPAPRRIRARSSASAISG